MSTENGVIDRGQMEKNKEVVVEIWRLGSVQKLENTRYFEQEGFNTGNQVLTELLEGRESGSLGAVVKCLDHVTMAANQRLEGSCFFLVFGNSMKPLPTSQPVYSPGLDSRIKYGCCKNSDCCHLCVSCSYCNSKNSFSFLFLLMHDCMLLTEIISRTYSKGIREMQFPGFQPL